MKNSSYYNELVSASIPRKPINNLNTCRRIGFTRSGSNVAYAIRHGRVNEFRTCRLDNLAKFLKSLGVLSFEVQFKK